MYRTMKTITIIASVVFCILLMARNAQAVSVPDYINTEISEAQLQGQGLLTWFGLKIYSANLWVSKKKIVRRKTY